MFVCVAPDAAEAEVLDRFGLVRGSGARHAGQGTRNVRYFFQDAYLELIWIDDPVQARSPLVRRTGLWERCRWRETGACPLGIALYRDADADASLPVATWSYRPPSLPDGTSIDVADLGDGFGEPLVFIVPSMGPPRASGARTEPGDHRAGVKRITDVRLTVTTESTVSTAIQSLVADAGKVDKSCRREIGS